MVERLTSENHAHKEEIDLLKTQVHELETRKSMLLKYAVNLENQVRKKHTVTEQAKKPYEEEPWWK
jgi:hypothetical protein